MIDDPSYDGNHINGIIELIEKGIGVRLLFLKWVLQARWIDNYIDEQKNRLSEKIGKIGKDNQTQIQKC